MLNLSENHDSCEEAPPSYENLLINESTFDTSRLNSNNCRNRSELHNTELWHQMTTADGSLYYLNLQTSQIIFRKNEFDNDNIRIKNTRIVPLPNVLKYSNGSRESNHSAANQSNVQPVVADTNLVQFTNVTSSSLTMFGDIHEGQDNNQHRSTSSLYSLNGLQLEVGCNSPSSPAHSTYSVEVNNAEPVESFRQTDSISSATQTHSRPQSLIHHISRRLYGEDIASAIARDQTVIRDSSISHLDFVRFGVNPISDSPRSNSEASSSPRSRDIGNVLNQSYFPEDILSYLGKDGGVKRRVQLPHQIVARSADIARGVPAGYEIFLTLKQPRLAPNRKSPQGNLPAQMSIGIVNSLSRAEAICKSVCPPTWAGPNDPQLCVVCRRTFGLLRPGHHCRNCGYLVCTQCSAKAWPKSMIPETFYDRENFVRVCYNCDELTEIFAAALVRGNEDEAKAAYDSGNVNVHLPLSIYAGKEYPIHLAARGGSLNLVKWLLEDRFIPMTDKSGLTLRTADGLTPLAIAAKYGHADIIKYLVLGHRCKVSELTDQTLLWKALHVILKLPGPLPSCIFNKRANTWSLTEDTAEQSEERSTSIRNDQSLPPVAVAAPINGSIAGVATASVSVGGLLAQLSMPLSRPSLLVRLDFTIISKPVGVSSGAAVTVARNLEARRLNNPSPEILNQPVATPITVQR